MSLSNREALYGGAAGGGKSEALLMAALEYIHLPDYSAMLFRRTYADLILPEALLDRAHSWLGPTNAEWKDNGKCYIFPTEIHDHPGKLSFGYLENENDKYRYQSAAFQYIGFDETTQFAETQYRYLFSRLRRLKSSNMPLRMRGATNPGGIGHEWVKHRFIDPGSPDRPYISARLEDNPYLDQNEYAESLKHLDSITRAQLLSGDWTARREGSLFRREWFGIVDAVPANMRTLRYWDMAATKEGTRHNDPDWTAGALLGLHDGIWYILNMTRLRGTPHEVQKAILQRANLDGVETPVRMEQEGGASGVTIIDHYARSVLVGYNFRGDKPSKNKIARAGAWSSAAEAGNVKLLCGPWIEEFLDEIELFPDGPHDDQVDVVSGAFNLLAAKQGRPRVYGPTIDADEGHKINTLITRLDAIYNDLSPDERLEAQRLMGMELDDGREDRDK